MKLSANKLSWSSPYQYLQVHNKRTKQGDGSDKTSFDLIKRLRKSGAKNHIQYAVYHMIYKEYLEKENH